MLCDILSERRRNIGMSIDQLVEKSMVPKGTVTKVLTGVSPNPALETVKAIAYALGLTLNDLVEEKNACFSESAARIAMLYDSFDDDGKELMECIAAYIEKRMKKHSRIGFKAVPLMEMGDDSKLMVEYLHGKRQKEMDQAVQDYENQLDVAFDIKNNEE